MRLVLAVDLNAPTDPILSAAAVWATRLGAKLDLVYVDELSYEAYFFQDPEVRTLYERERQKIRAHSEERLTALRETLPEEVRGDTVIRNGRAFDEIVAAARGCDAVLVGTHGRKGLSHAILGSVAERVVRTATVPVLVLRQTG